ncbi:MULTISPECIES: glycoside hydrolase family 105 protein [Flavobacterium]|uniref:glycoside hydrolase family 88/105 protein n=1 Tax=Flavobacterium TaxID=237 RepID=UPI001183C189|nr:MULTISPECIES: glycoside hydrolase family 88 protein [Flavobacterium]MCR4033690.1 glycoside hydrolase family 88 protein [Flavobacterium panacis]
MTYKIKYCCLALFVGLISFGQSKSKDKKELTPIEWAIKMADSDQKRVPNPVFLDGVKYPKWNYTNGLVALANQKLYDYTKNQKYWDYGLSYAEQLIDKDGNIQGGYEIDKYSLDLINSGKILFDIYKKTNDSRYKIAMDVLHKQLEGHPRNSDGGYWHKKSYPWQMWLDGVYMADPFSAQYGQVFNNPKAIDDAILQAELIQKHTFDAKTGLNFHGYDEKRVQFWANKTTGTSSHIWGRAQGWYCMALVDILDFVPENHPKRKDLIKIVQKVFDAVLKAQDSKTGVWWQVMDQPGRKGNYLESTCSTMFVYSFTKAYNKGYVGKKFLKSAQKGFNGIQKEFIKDNTDGTISITKCCAVAGLGGKNPEDRNGSFEYYISEPIREDDAKAVGPYILAGIELQKFQDKK